MDDETRRQLDLVHGSQSCALLDDGTLQPVASIGSHLGMVLVAGSTVLANGTELPSVLAIATSSGEPHANYWLFGGVWLDSTDAADRERLGLQRHDVFPYDWSTVVPLEHDAYHGEGRRRRPPLP